MPSKAVTDEIVISALTALEKLTAHTSNKNIIFGDEHQIFMEIRCIKIPHSKGNIKFVLPHSTVLSSKEVCLVTPDIKKGKKVDHEPTVDKWEELLRGAGVTSVKTILPMRQLRVEYDQFELKRRLLTQHDFIMVDTRVLNHVSHILGKMFFKKHNMLIPVKIDETKDVKKDIDVGLRTVMLRISAGQTTTIVVGHTGMQQNDIKENILAVVNMLNKKFPGGEANIRGLAIKLPLSLSLPIYMTLRPGSSVKTVPKLKHPKPKSHVMYEDELSTHLRSTVRVNPDGTVKLKLQPQKKKERIVEDDILSDGDDNQEDDEMDDDGDEE
ncbi:ribosomal L1 domain-containing protein 1 [Danaus plexippus plexippus]|uniref:Ribosomal L1 domain-containing protein 1 n=1 Tax=Danaus plexippus plexippus TaxID=278856 RepID=A0A212FBT1_DANPL|nr:ribosomal L1 domain-containing protein 1 [Danaus plexippus plexippus]